MTGLVLALAVLVLGGLGVLGCVVADSPRNWFACLDRIGGKR